MDVWERAYYLDYQNQRPSYIDTFLNDPANWDYVTQNLTAAWWRVLPRICWLGNEQIHLSFMNFHANAST